MKQMSSAQVRQMWLDFWATKGHAVEPSVSLVPVNDPTLLWINSGVATLKKYFDGKAVRDLLDRIQRFSLTGVRLLIQKISESVS